MDTTLETSWFNQLGEERRNGEWKQNHSRCPRHTRGRDRKSNDFPVSFKFDQSRRMPYLAMLDRLRAFFQGKDAPRLVVCGYSFLDDHLNEVLLDGLRGNRNAQCFALMFSGLNQHPRVVEYAQRQSNLTVLAWDGAVVGTRVGGYRAGTAGGQEHAPWLLEETQSAGESKEAYPRSRLGDFHYFGLLSNFAAVGMTRDQLSNTYPRGSASSRM
jgi:hypothetical protein